MGHTVSINRYPVVESCRWLSAGAVCLYTSKLCFLFFAIEAIDEGVLLSPLHPTTQRSISAEESLHFTSLLHRSLMALPRFISTLPPFPLGSHSSSILLFTQWGNPFYTSCRSQIPPAWDPRSKGTGGLEAFSKMKKTLRVPCIFYSLPCVFIHLGPNLPHIIWMRNHAIMPMPAQVIVIADDICVDVIWHDLM